jgi:energy-coupling factor transporter transmembrane protein EcfT
MNDTPTNQPINKVTPLHDLSWYVKWISSLFVMTAWMLSSANLYPYNIMVQIVGVAGWLWVGYLWHDRAIMVLNAMGVMFLGIGLVKYFLQ